MAHLPNHLVERKVPLNVQLSVLAARPGLGLELNTTAMASFSAAAEEYFGRLKPASATKH